MGDDTRDSLPQCGATEPNNVGSSRELFPSFAVQGTVTYAAAFCPKGLFTRWSVHIID